MDSGSPTPSTPLGERRGGWDRRTGREPRWVPGRRASDRRDPGERAVPEAEFHAHPLSRLFPYAPFNVREAADRVAAIEAHRRDLASRLGRDVGLPVAALDYLQNITGELLAPRIVEDKVLDALEHRSITDPLTGLFNRYHFDATLTREVARCLRYGTRLSLLLIDVDQMKAVNDGWGHQVGDRLLSRVAGAMRQSLRSSDVVSRYGGDEFAIILPDADGQAGRLVAGRICSEVKAAGPVEAGGPEPGVMAQSTVSGGVAELPPAATMASGDLLIVAADQALYLAKRRGGNCVAGGAADSR